MTTPVERLARNISIHAWMVWDSLDVGQKENSKRLGLAPYVNMLKTKTAATRILSVHPILAIEAEVIEALRACVRFNVFDIEGQDDQYVIDAKKSARAILSKLKGGSDG